MVEQIQGNSLYAIVVFASVTPSYLQTHACDSKLDVWTNQASFYEKHSTRADHL